MKQANSQERGALRRRLFDTDGEFSAFFKLYDEISTRSNHFVVDIDRQHNAEPLGHTDVLCVIDKLTGNPRLTKEEVTSHLREETGQQRSANELIKIIDLAVQALIMVDCDAVSWHAPGYTLGSYKPTFWALEEEFLSFVERSFPATDDVNERVRIAIEGRSSMKPWKLQQRLGIRFVGTSNFAQHLIYDPKRNSLYIFHHVEFLKAHLAKHRCHSKPMETSIADNLRGGTLPPQLLIETLHSLQEIIFPLIDKKSSQILDQLMSQKYQSFDNECSQYDGYQVVQEVSEDFTYIYWGERIKLIHDLLLNRPPRNKLERWLEWQSSGGNALLIALLALAISILVGLISIGLAGVQIWISWMAWKHPTG